MKKELKLSIEGMHCAACVRRVTTALHSVDGLQLNAVQIGSADITFDPAQVSIEAIFSAVNGIGFQAHLDE